MHKNEEHEARKRNAIGVRIARTIVKSNRKALRMRVKSNRNKNTKKNEEQ